ncbi:MAG TPA: hypothetical protein VNA22_04945 [Pyrinomonadaceae bacterium]|nr:hypothetical protein [Pyrinomonadaceae bacterium]
MRAVEDMDGHGSKLVTRKVSFIFDGAEGGKFWIAEICVVEAVRSMTEPRLSSQAQYFPCGYAAR